MSRFDRLFGAGVALASVLALAAPAASQPAKAYEGDWTGVLTDGVHVVHVVLHVKSGADSLSAILDDPDEGLTLPATAIKTDGGEFSALFFQAGGELKGKLSADGGTLEGSWTKGTPIPLKLTRQAPAAH
ncbi:MAG TPA: hypothetical protein VHN39_05415 [Phenylobacterium sp.]|nr:hypothetical protein [Phenylobacterium sp.]